MLKQICSQPWVREKLLSSPDKIVSMEKSNPAEWDDMGLLDRALSPEQVGARLGSAVWRGVATVARERALTCHRQLF